jgi:hypothetical protein
MELHELQGLLRDLSAELPGVLQSIWQTSKSDTARIKAIEVFMKYAYEKDAKRVIQNFDNMKPEEVIVMLREELTRQERLLQGDMEEATLQ